MSASGSLCWPTCRANEEKGGDYQNQVDGSTQPTLTGSVRNWATPTSSENSNRTTQMAPSHGLTHGLVLAGQAASWPSPRAEDSESCGNHPQATDSLTGAVKGFALKESAWPTPSARDQKGENGAEHLENGSGRLHLDQLPNFVKFRFSLPAPETPENGSASSEPPPTLRPRLNPAFVCWLMGWPWWWTRAEPISFGARAMASWRSRQRSRLWSCFPELNAK